MRSIEGKLTPALEKKLGAKGTVRSIAFPAQTYAELVEQTAQLAYLNKDYLLFYRGQTADYLNKAQNSTLYPSIYRGDYLPQAEINHRFDLLAGASRVLVKEFKKAKIQGTSELERKRYIQWSILQHYEVCATPLLDLTHSLRVACSFAELDNSKGTGFVYIFGLPYITNRISINSEHDIVNVRLLSICPPEALRPYYQEGYLVGTDDVTNQFDSKPELDLNNRLIAKFSFRVRKTFWGADFSEIPRDALYPRKDKVLDICKVLRQEVKTELQSGELGDFLKSWADLEAKVFKSADMPTRNITIREAINKLRSDQLIDEQSASRLELLRRFRNQLVHAPREATPASLAEFNQILESLQSDFAKGGRKKSG
jgi:hypothetical protein